MILIAPILRNVEVIKVEDWRQGKKVEFVQNRYYKSYRKDKAFTLNFTKCCQNSAFAVKFNKENVCPKFNQVTSSVRQECVSRSETSHIWITNTPELNLANKTIKHSVPTKYSRVYWINGILISFHNRWNLFLIPYVASCWSPNYHSRSNKI